MIFIAGLFAGALVALLATFYAILYVLTSTS